MSTFLHKQAQYLLGNSFYALCLTAVLAVVPFAAWLSLAVVMFITLRKGAYDGFRLLCVGAVAAFIASVYSIDLPYADSITLITFLVGYLCALLLRSTASWNAVTSFIMVAAIVIISALPWLAPEFVIEQYRFLLEILKEAGQAEYFSQLVGEPALNQSLLADYLLGIKIFSIAMSVLASLSLARYMQSLLFYPGGFRKEILAFRASRTGMIFLIMAIIGAYKNNVTAMSCLPILVTYFMAAGMSLGFNMIRKSDRMACILLFVPIFVVPYIMLPVYVLFGSLDSVFNFRLRLLSKAVKLKKG